MRMSLLITTLIIFFMGCANSSETNDEGRAHTLMEQTWKEFRAHYPESFQTIGLRHYGDTCVFVISEPPKQVSSSALEQIFTQYEGKFLIGQYKKGYDGMIYDGVGCAVLDSFLFSHIERDIFTLVYGTDYKPYYTDLDSQSSHIYFSPVNLDFTITNENLLGWLKHEIFSGPDLRETDINDLISESSLPGIYLSKSPGFIIWKIKYDALPISMTEARRFSLDSDLIAGAIKGEKSILIIAREREVPVTILPPLNAGTIVSLSNHDIDDCQVWLPSDSSICLGENLWTTPLIMSNSLRMSELGLLLTSADQTLKSWCVNGETYDRFSESPIPAIFPFKNGIVDAVKSTPACAWNIPDLSSQIFVNSISRTGSPEPIFISNSTLKSNKEKQAERTAQEWFASLSCTDLVRVNQYIFLYSIFRSMPNSANTGYGLGTQSSWVVAPSISVSNNPWLDGGCIAGVPIKIPKIKPPHIPTPKPSNPIVTSPGVFYSPLPPMAPTTPVLPNTNTTSTLSHNIDATNRTPSPSDLMASAMRDESHSLPRSSFISRPPSKNNSPERGFVPSKHNIAVEENSTVATQSAPNNIHKESPGWKNKLRQKIKNKIHRINTFEMQSDKYIIFGNINQNNNGKQLIKSTSEAYPFPHFTSTRGGIRA